MAYKHRTCLLHMLTRSVRIKYVTVTQYYVSITRRFHNLAVTLRFLYMAFSFPDGDGYSTFLLLTRLFQCLAFLKSLLNDSITRRFNYSTFQRSQLNVRPI